MKWPENLFKKQSVKVHIGFLHVKSENPSPYSHFTLFAA